MGTRGCHQQGGVTGAPSEGRQRRLEQVVHSQEQQAKVRILPLKVRILPLGSNYPPSYGEKLFPFVGECGRRQHSLDCGVAHTPDRWRHEARARSSVVTALRRLFPCSRDTPLVVCFLLNPASSGKQKLPRASHLEAVLSSSSGRRSWRDFLRSEFAREAATPSRARTPPLSGGGRGGRGAGEVSAPSDGENIPSGSSEGSWCGPGSPAEEEPATAPPSHRHPTGEKPPMASPKNGSADVETVAEQGLGSAAVREVSLSPDEARQPVATNGREERKATSDSAAAVADLHLALESLTRQAEGGKARGLSASECAEFCAEWPRDCPLPAFFDRELLQPAWSAAQQVRFRKRSVDDIFSGWSGLAGGCNISASLPSAMQIQASGVSPFVKKNNPTNLTCFRGAGFDMPPGIIRSLNQCRRHVPRERVGAAGGAAFILRGFSGKQQRASVCGARHARRYPRANGSEK